MTKHPECEQWLNYLDGTAPAHEESRISSHIGSCAECAAVAVSLKACRDALRQEAARMREDTQISEASLDRMLQAIPATKSGNWTAAEGLTLLHYLMEPICGPGAARATIELALRRSAESAGSVSARNWALFIENLTEATALICGLAAGRLVGRAGLSLGIEDA